MRRLRSNDLCWCGSARKFKRCHGDRRALQRPVVELGTISPVRAVPDEIVRPDYVDGMITTSRGIQLQTAESLEQMRRAGRAAAEVLLRAGAAVAPGVTTDELDAVAHDAYVSLGAYPSDLGYKGYPKSVCTSVNGVVCHGIPDDRPLAEGDIVNIDVTAYVDGHHGDTSATFIAGAASDAIVGLVETTREATLRGCAAARTGAPLKAIAEAIEPFAQSRGYEVVAEYGGHGIGATFHAAPHVNHTVSRRDVEPLRRGMTLTVEPMLLSGGRRFHQADDGWTEHTDDAMPSAQFEHTLAVGDDGPELLTVTAAGDTAVGTLDLLEALRSG